MINFLKSLFEKGRAGNIFEVFSIIDGPLEEDGYYTVVVRGVYRKEAITTELVFSDFNTAYKFISLVKEGSVLVKFDKPPIQSNKKGKLQ